MDRAQQGDLGEASARWWYETYGHVVFVPTGRSPDADFVADDGERLLRVQVKSCGRVSPYGRWSVSICTRGGNRSWSGLSKRFSPERCDELFVVTIDGRRWRIPSLAVEAATALSLGGAKYAGFEVDAGPPLVAASPSRSLTSRVAAG